MESTKHEFDAVGDMTEKCQNAGCGLVRHSLFHMWRDADGKWWPDFKKPQPQCVAVAATA